MHRHNTKLKIVMCVWSGVWVFFFFFFFFFGGGGGVLAADYLLAVVTSGASARLKSAATPLQ